jgi:hypothetical protein
MISVYGLYPKSDSPVYGLGNLNSPTNNSISTNITADSNSTSLKNNILLNNNITNYNGNNTETSAQNFTTANRLPPETVNGTIKGKI